MMNPIFSDPKSEEQFRSRGYVVIPDFLDSMDLRSLTELSDRSHDHNPPDYHVTAFSRNTDYRRLISKGIIAILEEKFKQNVPNYSLCLANFVRKAPQSKQNIRPIRQEPYPKGVNLLQAISYCPELLTKSDLSRLRTLQSNI